MENVELVIKISEKAYNALTHTEFDANLVVDEMRKSIVDGTPLPKGHGALKDVDNIKTAFPSGEYVRTESVRATIDHEDTIIEADEGSE